MSAADVVVVGAGAAGTMAAIFAARAGARVLLLERTRDGGRKILISGGGRCNVLPSRMTPQQYVTASSPNTLRRILLSWPLDEQQAFFERELGLPLQREAETGKLFPVTDSARTVLNALLRRCDELGVKLLTDHRVREIDAADPFVIRHNHGELRADKVIMASGGRSLPKTGSDGLGWDIVTRLGHMVTPTYPALVPLVLDAQRMFHAELSGISHPAELSTFADDKRIDHRFGSLLWTHFGISGPVAMDASRHWVIAKQTGRSVELRCSFFPGQTTEQVERQLVAMATSRPRVSLARLLAEHLPDRVVGAIVSHAGIDPSIPIGNLPRETRRKLAAALTALPLPVLQDRGWNYAEVTAGGVPLNEIDFRTMQSRKVPGLFLIGEMLDCDGRIGGFNFQWAWSTGHIAGKAAARASDPS